MNLNKQVFELRELRSKLTTTPEPLHQTLQIVYTPKKGEKDCDVLLFKRKIERREARYQGKLRKAA